MLYISGYMAEREILGALRGYCTVWEVVSASTLLFFVMHPFYYLIHVVHSHEVSFLFVSAETELSPANSYKASTDS
jgi:hypothetical protein